MTTYLPSLLDHVQPRPSKLPAARLGAPAAF
jgi:hypothetical protein